MLFPLTPPDIFLLMIATGCASPPSNGTQASALTLCKQIKFEGLQVELFQDIEDPIAMAEGDHLISQMRLAESQLAADLAGSGGMQAFEREAVTVPPAKAESVSSGFDASDNR